MMSASLCAARLAGAVRTGQRMANQAAMCKCVRHRQAATPPPFVSPDSRIVVCRRWSTSKSNTEQNASSSQQTATATATGTATAKTTHASPKESPSSQRDGGITGVVVGADGGSGVGHADAKGELGAVRPKRVYGSGSPLYAPNPTEYFSNALANVERPQLSHMHDAIETYAKNQYKVGSLDFIRTTLDVCDRHGISLDLRAYNGIFDTLPKGRYIRSPKDIMRRKLNDFEKTTLDVLGRMETEGVCPDLLTYDHLFTVFDWGGPVIMKCLRLMYWFDRFGKGHRNRLYLPLPKDRLALAKISLMRMHGKGCVLREHTDDERVGHDSPFVASGSTPADEGLLRECVAAGHSVTVDGPHLNWIGRHNQPYYALAVPSTGGPRRVVSVCVMEPPTHDRLWRWIDGLEAAAPGISAAPIVVNITNLAKDDEEFAYRTTGEQSPTSPTHAHGRLHAHPLSTGGKTVDADAITVG
eukprot:Opistho-2@18372